MQFLDEVFVILGIIKVEICFISQDRGLRLITFTATLIISDITDSECSNCFIIHCYEEMYRPTPSRSHGALFDIALGGHAFRTQPADWRQLANQ